MSLRTLGLLLLGFSFPSWAASAFAADTLPLSSQLQPGNVILIHPDGSSLNAWNAFRIATVGPDALTQWDQLPGVALYRSHFRDGLSPASHGGATVHAWGRKVSANSYGTDAGAPITARSGAAAPLLVEARRAGLPVGIVQSGHLAEPGTGVFLASSASREDYAGIVATILASDATVVLAGGEVHLLPEGVSGRHCAAGKRTDGRDLLAEARAAGYTVVQTREELSAAATDPAVKKLFGCFAAWGTYQAAAEEKLAEKGEPLYAADAPTVAEMTAAALAVLERAGPRFALVVEEEGTDDFPNQANASGTFEAFRRADAAIGVAREFVARRPDTLLLTAADSDASGLQLIGRGAQKSPDQKPDNVPPRTDLGNPIDGVAGQGTAAFLSGPDRAGCRFWFGVTFATPNDVVGGVVVRAEGLNRARLPLNLDNTQLYVAMWETLFGRELPAE
jgi:alkaline phosphatase